VYLYVSSRATFVTKRVMGIIALDEVRYSLTLCSYR